MKRNFMPYDWNETKNEQLKRRHGVGFEDVILALNEDRLVATMPHPNVERYPSQEIFVVWIGDYAYVVPYVRDGATLFLKTLYPSRQMKKRYGGPTDGHA